MIWWIVGAVVAVLALWFWAACALASRADDEAEELFRDWPA